MAQDKWNAFPQVTKEELKTIITDPKGAETLVTCADGIGKALAKQLTTNQIRAIFGEVRRIEGEWKGAGRSTGENKEKQKEEEQKKAIQASRQLILLKPKMAYRAKRERGKGVEELVSVLTPAIDLVGNSQDNFTRFVDFFEAILAYHKAYGGS